jgi:hypothetical protein
MALGARQSSTVIAPLASRLYRRPRFASFFQGFLVFKYRPWHLSKACPIHDLPIAPRGGGCPRCVRERIARQSDEIMVRLADTPDASEEEESGGSQALADAQELNGGEMQGKF